MSELTAHIDLPRGAGAPRAARHAIRPILEGWGFAEEGFLDCAAIVVSELVSNAVRHAGGCLELQLSLHDGQVTISTVDGSPVVPRRREPAIDGGRGIAIIEALSHEWGVEDYHGGKRVWARLSHRREAGR